MSSLKNAVLASKNYPMERVLILMNAKTLVVAQTILPRVITPLVHSRAFVQVVTLQDIKAGVTM